MKQKMTRVVVVGGGFGGVKTALELANKPGFAVQLISDNSHFEYHGALYRSAVGHSPMEVVIPLKDIFAHAKNVEVVLDSIGFVNAKKHCLASLTGNTYPYDKLVLALGNTVNYFGIPGVEENSEAMHNINSTIKLRTKLVELFSKKHSKPVRIAVIGAGASGVELAAEIPQFAAFIAKKHRLKVPHVKVVLVDGGDRVLPLLKPTASTKAEQKLKKLGVELHLNIKVESCDSGNVCMSAGNLGADLIVWTAGSKPSEFYAKNPDVFTLSRNGKVVVDEYLRVKNWQNIFVIGDNADTKYSGMAQTALYNALYVSKLLMKQHQQKAISKYRNKKPVYVITVGPKWAVAQIGNRVLSGRAGWSVRRQADLAIFRNFQPYREAIKTWRQADKMSNI
ncbi:FAD-dependent oxidoreductase [Candidatus Saccharibacteria bacterium]|nr:FAD-dependent oxidoreductase [Candidatus Saccharibacteria bacterium]